MPQHDNIIPMPLLGARQQGERSPRPAAHFSDRESAFTERLLAERDRLAEFDRKPDLFARFAANDQRAYDKPLVAFFRRWSGHIGVALYVLAVLAAMYFAFRLGLGR